MTGWNDLPTELKEIVVQMVDDEQTVRNGLARGSSEEGQALIALSAMDRELHALVSPILWQTLDLNYHSMSRLEFFAAEIGPLKGRFARHLTLHQPYNARDSQSTMSHERSDRASPPPSLESLADAAAVIYAFPNLVEAELSNIFQGEGQEPSLAVDALRSLPQLKKLSLRAGDGFSSPTSLALPWKSSLVSLNLGEVDDTHLGVSFLRHFVDRHSNTLQELLLPFYPDDASFPTFFLPHLHTLTLYVNDDSALLPLSFSASPLRILTIKLIGEEGDVENMVHKLTEAVAEHRVTLDAVSVEAFAHELAGDSDQEALDDLQALCEKEQICYDFDLVGP
ncbi:hypothetical protein BCR35DRAFT_355958 [Leucosporidium creatinivorum]|uniref:F-box domain-containing protein n=1 Tax=Leucosporidium creatinivorum TaxID=106004 RepID=A0A1Y2D486_9BASI|nr:hypothetical protein BCR35DRAFT_355958 [Leucosporidium creatinivorum]